MNEPQEYQEHQEYQEYQDQLRKPKHSRAWSGEEQEPQISESLLELEAERAREKLKNISPDQFRRVASFKNRTFSDNNTNFNAQEHELIAKKTEILLRGHGLQDDALQLSPTELLDIFGGADDDFGEQRYVSDEFPEAVLELFLGPLNQIIPINN